MSRTLKEWRVHKDYTQAELAERIGVPVSTYNAWERNTSSIKIGNVPKICDALDISAQDILFFDSKSYLKYDKQEVN